MGLPYYTAKGHYSFEESLNLQDGGGIKVGPAANLYLEIADIRIFR